MRKSSSVLLIFLLAASTVLILVPITAHATITGTPTLAYSNNLGTTIDGGVTFIFPTVTDVTSTINGTAGSALVWRADGANLTSRPAYFTIDTDTITNYAGANIYLFLSMNGNAQISGANGDIFYAGPFPALQLNKFPANFTATGHKQVYGDTNTSTYVIGREAVSSTAPGIIIGALPTLVNASYKFVKLYDGSCGNPTAAMVCSGTGVAGAKQQVGYTPGITITPALGAAGDKVTVFGGGFANGQMLNITYQYNYTNWLAKSTIYNGTWTGLTNIKTGTTFSTCPTPADHFFGPTAMEGTFCKSTTALDTKQPINQKFDKLLVNHLTQFYPYLNINISATVPNVESGYGILNQVQEYYAHGAFKPYYQEWSRQFNYIGSAFQGSIYEQNNPAGTYYPTNTHVGNDSGANSLYTLTSFGTIASPLQVPDSGSVNVTGSYFDVGAPLSVYVTGFGLVSSFTGTASPTAGGLFSINFTVPTLPLGIHNVSIVNNKVHYVFTIDIVPALILTPHYGTSSSPDTSVTATGFGFPGNAAVYLFWNNIVTSDFTAYNIANTTSDSSGTLVPVTFSVPDPTFGGSHIVFALDNLTLKNTWHTNLVNVVNGYYSRGHWAIDSVYGYEYATTSADFWVHPTLCVNVGSSTSCAGGTGNPTIQSVNANTMGTVTAYAEGLYPTTLYQVFVDSGSHGYLSTFANALYTYHFNGNAVINFTSTGFRPGLHQVELDMATQNTIALSGNQVNPTPSACGVFGWPSCYLQQANEGNFSTPLAVAYFNVTTTGDYIYSGFASLTSTMNSLKSTVNSLSTQVNTLSSDITSIQNTVNTISNNVNSIQSTVNSMSTTLSGLSTTIGNAASSASAAATAAQQAATAAQNAANNTNGLTNVSTYVLVVAVLAAITLVLELAILVRKLS